MNIKENSIKKRILFICLGNICRSPSAEAVMNFIIKKNNLHHLIEVDSAGTIAYHSGECADERMMKHAAKRGYELTSISRNFNPEADFEKFDYIVTMDEENYEDILHLDRENKYRNKIFRMADFCRVMDVNEVPDPYYGGSAGFELVLDILEDASEGLLEKVLNDIKRDQQKN